MNKSDPYVKLRVKKDNWFWDRWQGKAQYSSKKSNELSPEYDETFKFEGLETLKNMVLHVKVMDDDYGRDDDLGGVKLKLTRLSDLVFGPLNEEPRVRRAVVDQKQDYNPLAWLTEKIPGSDTVSRLFKKKAIVHLELSYAE